MCDFHRSLDRALEHEPRWAIDHTTAYDAPEPRPLPDSWQDLGYMDETGVGNDLLAIQAKINRDVASLAAMTLAPTLFVPEPEVIVVWQDPAPRWTQSLEFTASIETIELLCGAGLIPLCEREIPAEGTE